MNTGTISGIATTGHNSNMPLYLNPYPDESWLSRQLAGDLVYLPKENKFVTIAQIFRQGTRYNEIVSYSVGTGEIDLNIDGRIVTWMISHNGRGVDRSQCILPVEGNVRSIGSAVMRTLASGMSGYIQNRLTDQQLARSVMPVDQLPGLSIGQGISLGQIWNPLPPGAAERAIAQAGQASEGNIGRATVSTTAYVHDEIVLNIPKPKTTIWDRVKRQK